jgi:type IV pilus assembly protein PilO
MRLSPNTELLIGVAIIVVVALAVVAVVIFPAFGALGDLDAKLVKANQDVSSAKSVLTQRQSAKQQAVMTQAQLMTLQNAIPDSPELPTLIIELQDVAVDAGLNWIEVKPDTPDSRDGFSAIPLALKLNGSWPDMVDYVRRIGKLDRQIRITSLEIGPLNDPNASADTTSSDTNPPVDLTSTIKLEAYVIGSVSGGTQVPGAPSSSSSPTTKTP